jgi:hypothetical protein
MKEIVAAGPGVARFISDVRTSIRTSKSSYCCGVDKGQGGGSKGTGHGNGKGKRGGQGWGNGSSVAHAVHDARATVRAYGVIYLGGKGKSGRDARKGNG